MVEGREREKGKQFFTSRCWWHRKHFHPFLSVSSSLSPNLPARASSLAFRRHSIRMCAVHARVTSRRCAFCCFCSYFSIHNTQLLPSFLSLDSSYLVLCLLLKGWRAREGSSRWLRSSRKMLMTVEAFGGEKRREKLERKPEEDTFWLNFVACGCSIALLILVMPSIEVNMEYDDGARCQAGEQISVKWTSQYINGSACRCGLDGFGCLLLDEQFVHFEPEAPSASINPTGAGARAEFSTDFSLLRNHQMISEKMEPWARTARRSTKSLLRILRLGN